MCNLSDGVWEEAMTKGMAQGMEKGMAQGIEKGLVTALRNLIQNTGWTMEKAMDTLSIPEADRQAYAAQIVMR